MDGRGILIAEINNIADRLSLPALMEAAKELKAIEAWQHRPQLMAVPPLAEKIRGKLAEAAIAPQIVLDTEAGDRRNPRESELADKIREYFNESH
jgi:hypothetical protein